MSSWPHCKKRKYMLARHSWPLWFQCPFFFLTINYVMYINKLETEVGSSKKEGPKLTRVFFFFNRPLAFSSFYVIFRSSFCLLKIPGRRKGQCARLHCWKKWIVDFYSKPRMWKPLNLVLFQLSTFKRSLSFTGPLLQF